MKPTLTVPLQIKSLDKREFEGHGSIFGNVDLGGDVVMPGAFSASLERHRKAGGLPQMFWMHKPDKVPGKWVSMTEDRKGLRVKGVLADTPLGNEIHTLLTMEAVRGLSIGFQTVQDEYTDEGVRLLKELDLWEVSVVSLPMNPLAQVAHAKARLSSDGEYVPTAREFERALRDVGCTHTIAKRIVSKLFIGELSHRDGDKELRDVVTEAQQDDAGADVLQAIEGFAQAVKVNAMANRLRRRAG